MLSLSKTYAGLIVFVALSTLGCSRQGEGERCSLLNGDSDCEANLVCTEAENLRSVGEVDRCCPPPDEARTDSRCDLDTSGGDGDSVVNAGGQGGMSGFGSGELEDPCSDESDCLPQYTCSESNECAEIRCEFPSDCPASSTCGFRGVCRAECNENRDCASGFVCSDQKTCVAM